MTQSAKKYYTLEEYLALEEVAQTKNEYYRGEIFQMSGGSHNHNTITLNIASELNLAFRQRACTAYNSNMRVLI